MQNRSDDIGCVGTAGRGPIVVTTSVSFFEALASSRLGTLRSLHELPGSVIFADGAYAGLPLKLLPIAWRWIKYWKRSGAAIGFWDRIR